MTAAFDSRMHSEVLRHVVARGHAPTVRQLVDILGVPPSEVEASLRRLHGGEADEASIRFEEGRLASEELLVHFGLPPRDAWANVIHYCATVLPFRRVDDVDAWCARHRLPRGAVVPLASVLQLGRAWYGRHLDPEWRKWTLAEARAIFGGVGLSGEFWELPRADGRF